MNIFKFDFKLNNLEIKMILGEISSAIGYTPMVSCSLSVSHVRGIIILILLSGS